jgi:hypothetical protein
MIKSKPIFVVLCALCVIFIASCKSVPEPEQTAPVAPPGETAVQPQAGTGDQRANRAASLLADVEKARQEAVDAGAEIYCPDELARLDSVFDELKKEAGQNPDSDEVFDRGTDMVIRYRALEKAAKALAAKEEVDNRGLARYVPDVYAEGEDALGTLQNANVTSDDAEELADAADRAYVAYTKVLAEGLARLAAEAQADRNAAVQAKARADGIKSAVTEKDSYAEAVASLAAGDDMVESGDIEAARSSYQTARDSFDAIFARVSKKRDEAAEAMRLAALRARESAAFALQADAIESSTDDEDEEE